MEDRITIKLISLILVIVLSTILIKTFDDNNTNKIIKKQQHTDSLIVNILKSK